MSPAALRRLAACLAALGPLSGAAAETVVGAEYGVETLGGDAPNWEMATVSATHTRDKGAVHVEWLGVERFGVSDAQWRLSGSAREHDLTLTIDFSGSADHDVLPEFGMGFDLAMPVGAGVVPHVGARQNRYTEDTATILQAGAELYRGNWRFAYTLTRGRLDSGESGIGHVAQADHYYGEGSRIGAIVAFGDEATRIDPTTVVVSEVRAFAIVGRHWLDRRWGLTCVWGRTEQGDFYTRKGPLLGLLFRF